ncbi:rhodanese-like domain-containing protein [Roseovarius sp. C7]|uniref:rhodanese-like domain-containing protein n=1 Tax=Roseovarius sp. C7 TaxID=3398643 RepID=UPI0039F739C5
MKRESVDGKTLETWDAQELQDALESRDAVLIDVRSPAEYMLGHVAGSLLMPMPDFDAKALPEKGKKRLVLMCGSGMRSEKMARKVLAAGAEQVAHLDGGFGAWKEAKLPHVAVDFPTGGQKAVNQD